MGIQAKSSASNYEKFEVMFNPCNYMHSSFNYTDVPVTPGCVKNLTQIQEYLAGSQLTILYNDKEFDKTKYGEEAIMRSSKFFIK